MRFQSVAVLLPALVAAFPRPSLVVRELADSIVARAPPEANALLKSVTANGTGCTGNSASFVFGDSATVGFDSMVVDSTQIDKTKRCVITFNLQLDSEWKYTINKATNVRGYVENDGGSYKVKYSAGGKTVRTFSFP